MRRPLLMPCLAIALALFAGACSRQETAWDRSHRTDSVAAYEAYLRDYPGGAHAAEARSRMAALQEQDEWERALRINTPEAFQRYLAGYPSGRYAETAKQKLSAFLPAQAPPAPAGPPAPAAGTSQAAGTLLAAAGKSGEYRLQLGAFGRGEDAAHRAWRELSRRHPDLLGTLTPRVDMVEHGGRRLWRLQAGPLARDRAQSLCARLKAGGTPCLVVHD